MKSVTFSVATGFVMLGLQNEREWAAFCADVLRQPALAGDERFATVAQRSANRDALRELIVAAFAPLSGAEVVARLDTAGIANARVNDMHDVWGHPQLAARGRWRDVATPAGRIPALLPPGSWEEGEPRCDAVPAVGQHTDAILAELGYTPERIAALRADRAI